MKRLLLTTAIFVFASSSALAAPQEHGGTRWTSGPGDVIEITRYPKGRNPTFTVLLEQFDPPDVPCNAYQYGHCNQEANCLIYVELSPEVAPLVTINEDHPEQNRIWLAGIDQPLANQVGNGTRATIINAHGLYIGRNGEGLKFTEPGRSNV